MNYFKAARFSLQMFMQQELFQHEYVEELQKNPLLQLSLKCSQFNQFVAECEAKHGPGNAECQSGRLEAAACAASVFAPSHFSKWIACLDANQDKANPLEECENQGMDAIEESANQYERMVARGAVYVSRRQIERCESECSFLSEDFNTETMECVIPIVCPEEVDNFLKCAEKNKNDYGAAACQSLGKELARKMAQTMGDLSIVIEKEGSQN